jgi:serine/threonine-protein kinase
MAEPLNGETELYVPPNGTVSKPPSVLVVSKTTEVEEGRFVPGTLLGGRYRILSLLGQGGMGEVYRATDLLLGQSVALKFLTDAATGNQSLLERFQGEVRVARQISHPNICRVYDIGEIDGLPFISMEYVDGEDLTILLQRIGRLPMDKACEAAREICTGLAAAHRKGVIHRDLKPQNIMMNRRGEIVIMDFGLAAITQQLSGPEVRNGTPAYMSPEQLKGTEVTAKSDIYALGLVLYELFTGRKPFSANSVSEWITLQESSQFPDIASIVPDADPGIDRIIRRCLDPDPRRRPDSPLLVSSALPGGDPLSAALAAGKTLSPEAVARAGETGGLALKYSLPCLATIILSLILAPALKQAKISLYQARDEYAPAALRQKARDFAAAAGYTHSPVDTAARLYQRLELLTYLQSLPGLKDWKLWLAGEAPILQIYRESLSPLVAPPVGFVTPANPALTEPGMVEVQLDGQARLRGFAAVPYPADSGAVDPQVVFRAAQLDLEKFVEITPSESFHPPWSDRLRAWKGKHPVLPNTDLTVQVAFWKNQVTAVQVQWPWMLRSRSPGASRASVFEYRSALLTIANCAGLIVASLLAGYNWKRGRSDRRGAFRIAAFNFVLSIGSWVGTSHLVPNDAYSLFLGGVSDALLSASILFFLYIALEPTLRARWPHSIVTWNRVLAGSWRDPQVSGHILIGTAVGALMWTMGQVRDVLAVSNEGLDTVPGLLLLNGTREWFAGILSRGSRGLETGLVVFFLVFVLRTLLRKEWLAAIAGTLLYAASPADLPNSANWPAELALYVLMFGLFTLAMLRLGLVVAIVAAFTNETMGSITLGTNFMAWYVPTGLATAALVLAISLASFKLSMGTEALSQLSVLESRFTR